MEIPNLEDLLAMNLLSRDAKKILRLLADRSVDWHLSDKMIVCQNLHSSTHVSHTIVVLFSFL